MEEDAEEDEEDEKPKLPLKLERRFKQL